MGHRVPQHSAPSRAVRVREAGAEHVIIETMDPLRHVPPAHKFDLARQLRREGTPMERYAWSLLRNHGVLKLKFRRQHVLHGFIVDFYCAAERLVLELEGDGHEAGEHGQDDRRSLDEAGRAGLRAFFGPVPVSR